MIQSLEPIRGRMLDLQKEGKISIIAMNYGFEKGGVFLTIEFDINEKRGQVRSYVCRTLTGKIMEGCVAQALSLLDEVK